MWPAVRGKAGHIVVRIPTGVIEKAQNLRSGTVSLCWPVRNEGDAMQPLLTFQTSNRDLKCPLIARPNWVDLSTEVAADT